MTTDLSEIRRRAWKTRRAKYGAHGHSGCYSSAKRSRALAATMAAYHARDEISVARRHLQMLLPHGAAHRAITALDRADDYLAIHAPDLMPVAKPTPPKPPSVRTARHI